MTGYLLDSDILIDFFNKREPAQALVSKFLGSRLHMAISVLSVTELRAGWGDKECAVYLPVLYDLFPAEIVTLDVAELAGKLRHNYQVQGKVLKTVDTTIAATAIINEYCLVTRNIKDFPMPELNLYRGPLQT
jgi:predicted nucleic acid-binding protein